MKRHLVTVLMCALSWSALAQTQNVHEYYLDNGIKLIVKEDHRSPVAVSQVWYKVGASYEFGGITGISHALEHMMFKGTQKYGQGQLSQIVAKNGGVQNAMTADDYTVYFQIFSNNKLPVSFDLESDRMQHLNLDSKEFAKEIQVVMEERRLRTDDNPESLTYERFQAAAHIASPYHHPVVGWMDDLLAMTSTDLRKWYSNWYSPSNAVIVVVGDVNPDNVYQQVRDTFGKVKKREVPIVKPQKSVRPLGIRELVVKAPAKMSYLLMGYNVPVLKTTENEWEPYALEVAAWILDGGKSARFEKELVRKQQIASSVNVQYNLFSRLDNLFMMDARPALNHTTKEVKAALLEQIKKLRETLVTPEELSRVKAQVVASQTYKKDSMSGQAMEIGALEAVGLPWKLADQFSDKIQAVTAEQVQRVARKYLVDERLTVAELQPLPITDKKPRPVQSGGHHVR